MSRSKLLAAAAFALPMMVASAGSAQANVIALVIDTSGSISCCGVGTEFYLQQQGYKNALSALLKPDGQNYIGIWQFSTTVQQELGILKISTVADINTVLNALSAMNPMGNSTAIGLGIQAGKNAVNSYLTTNANCIGVNAGKCGGGIIDVSTDGVENVNETAGNPLNGTSQSNQAFALGIKVNCIGIELPTVTSCAFNNATNGSDYFAASFAAFETAITAKLSAELTPTPEPLTMSLFGAGLVGAAALRRRKAKTA